MQHENSWAKLLDTSLEKKGLRGRTPGKARRINNLPSPVRNVNAHWSTNHTIKTLNTVHAHAFARVGGNSGISSTCPWLSRGRRVTGSRTRIQDRDGTEIRSTAAWSRVQASERDESSPPFLSSRVDAPRPPRPFLDPSSVASLSPPSWTRNNITDVSRRQLSRQFLERIEASTIYFQSWSFIIQNTRNFNCDTITSS